jgi:hypothetical protein
MPTHPTTRSSETPQIDEDALKARFAHQKTLPPQFGPNLTTIDCPPSDRTVSVTPPTTQLRKRNLVRTVLQDE